MTKFLLIIFSYGVSMSLNGQSGPGGVGSEEDASSKLILWMAADKIDSVFDGNNLSKWADASAYSNDLSQDASSSKPNYIASDADFNDRPVIQFNGTTEYLDGNLGGPLSSETTIFSVFAFDNSSQGAENDYIYSIGTVNSNPGAQLSLARRRSDGANADLLYSIENLSNLHFAELFQSTSPTISTQTLSSSATYLSLDIDGTSQTFSSDYTGSLDSDGIISLGNWADASTTSSEFLFDGRVAELIIFDEELSVPEKRIVEMHLAAKYDIGSLTADLYDGDDNGDHDFDVIGVGSESGFSHTNSTAAGVTLSINSNFDDGDYVVMGHDTFDNSVNTTDTDLSLEGRWERVWWINVDEQAGSSLTVDLSFNFLNAGLGGSPSNASNYRLIYRNGVGGSWSDAGLSASISGNTVSFEDIDLVTLGEGQFTLASSDLTNSTLGMPEIPLTSNGPGGLGKTDGTSSLELWLDASSILGGTDDFVVSWNDKSGNDAHASPNPTSLPKLQASAINDNKFNTIVFDVTNGSNDYFSGDLGNLDAPATIVAVTYFAQLNQGDLDTDNDYVISIGTTGTQNEHTSISRRQSGGNTDDYYAFDGTTVRFGPNLTGQQWMVLTQVQNSTSQYHDMYLDGSVQTTLSPADFSSPLDTDGTYEIGRWDGTQQYFLGEIAEVIIFSEALNSAKINILHSYLDAKYGNPTNTLSLVGDKYAGDDTGGDLDDYDYEVAGIGVESDGSNDVASSGGLKIEINTGISNGFENGDYVLFGHKNVKNSTNTTDITADTATLQGRWERLWYVDVTDATTSIVADVTFDYSDTGLGTFPGGEGNIYKLLRRDNHSSGIWDTFGDGVAVNGDQVVFENVPLIDGYYTLASKELNSNPLPVELLYFSIETDENEFAKLLWATVSEINTDYFEIERSKDGVAFESIGRVYSEGDFSGLREYRHVDRNAEFGSNYYRLRIVDFDGYQEHSEIKRFERALSHALAIYPNPSDDQVNVMFQGETEESIQLVIFDINGGTVYSSGLIDATQPHSIDISDQPPAIYIMEIFDSHGKSMGKRKVIKN